MSSTTSRAPTTGSGWQLQSDTKKSNHNLIPQQSFKTHDNLPVTSYPNCSTAGSNSTLQSVPVDDYDLHQQNPHVGGLESGSSSDLYSQQLGLGSYLTPDYGSEIPYSSEQSTYDSPDQGNDLVGMISKEAATSDLDSLSTVPPMSTTTVTSTILSEPRSMTPAQLPIPRTPEDTGKRARSLEEDEVRFSRSASHQQSTQAPTISMRDAINPTVLISTYNRGDSPARIGLPNARSLSKRTQGSRLSDHNETVTPHEFEISAATSRLMPPDQYGNANWDDDEEEDASRGGVAPAERISGVVSSLKDMEKQRELDENRVGVENWLAKSETGCPNGSEADRGVRNPGRRERIRSRSTGSRTDPAFSDKNILGPGMLLDVESEDEYSDDGSSRVSMEESPDILYQSPPANVDAFDPNFKQEDQSYFPQQGNEGVAPEEQEPLPRQFYRRGPGEDDAHFAEPTEIRDQPPTSNHAIMQYDRQAAQFETASRAATWGTRRRLSDSEIASIISGKQVRHMSLSSKVRDRSSSIVNRARTVIRRSSSNVKKNKDHLHKQSAASIDAEQASMTENDHIATSPIQQVQRTFSWGKAKSPPLHTTSSALLAMTGHLTAIGGSATSVVEPPQRPAEHPKSPFLSALKRSRSKSDLPKTPGLSELFNRHGGPPVPTLASPLHLRSESNGTTQQVNATSKPASNIEEDMDDDNDEEVGITMELPIQHHNIIPNLDGFRTHAKQLNPRLEQYLVDRIAQDQLRRYKKLVESKVEHTRSVQLKRSCTSGEFCVDLGGKPQILPPRTSAKDSNVNYSQFRIGGAGDSDGEEATFVEGVVTPALFPQGIPLPPTTHLPAEFECPLCFQVKKFQKPSDWTKHVHEDVQPFSCTFKHCPEPKSFKRKADWVRHENERHRHLEWWKCSIPECAHICYRKDNFVQHLVREHKMTEPKAKGSKPTGSRTRTTNRSGQGISAEADDFWKQVNSCRRDTSQTPKAEPCKFCGNVCSTWKKLSIHVGKHMEQIAMPVLDLAAKRAITADTITSPVDGSTQRATQTSMLDSTVMSGSHLDALSPYAPSAASMYHSSSAGHSPVPMRSVHSQGSHTGPPFYEQSTMQAEMQPIFNNQYGMNGSNSHSYPYPSYDAINGHLMGQQTGAFSQQPQAQNIATHRNTTHIPRTQAMDSNFGSLNVDTMHANMYSNDGYYPDSAPGGSYIPGFNDGLNDTNSVHGQQPGQMQMNQQYNPNYQFQGGDGRSFGYHMG